MHLARSRNRDFTSRAKSTAHSRGMTSRDERSWLHDWHAHGDAAALARITRAQRPMIEKFAAAFARPGIAIDDLVQEGYVGLLTAIQRFDLQRRNRLADYAQHWVRLQMVRFVVRAATRRSSWSLDDRRRRRWLEALSDPAPAADEQLANDQEWRAQAARLREALASMSAPERELIAARHLGSDPSARHPKSPRIDADVEKRALAKLFLPPSDVTSIVDVLIGGRRQRLSAAHTRCW